MKNKITVKHITICAIMSAIAYVLMMLEFPIAFLIPSFIQFDFSELPALITSFALGPVYGAIVCFIKNLIHLPFTKTSGVGELANFLLGATFCLVTGFIYKYKKNLSGAILGCLIGSVAMALLSFPINIFITYPFYFNFMPKDAIIGMYSALLPFVKTLPTALLVFNVPFTLAKGLIDSLICFTIYKRISPILKINQGK